MQRTPVAWLAICVLLVLVGAGCRPTSADTSDIQMDLDLRPSPPVVGNADVSLSLAGPEGEPIEGADVRLEGNMNHAGMKPSFADLEETEPGTYAGTLDFTMGGDWFILVTTSTADGRRIERKIDVPGVKSP